MVGFLSRSDPQPMVTIPTSTAMNTATPAMALITTATATATTGTAPIQLPAGAGAAPLISRPADALVAVMGAQTERARITASAKLEEFKAETARIKDGQEHVRLNFAAQCDCYYKYALLVLAFVLVLVLLPRLTNLTFFGVIFTLTPTDPPPVPENKRMLAATDPGAPLLHLSHEVVRSLRRRRRPRFFVRLEGDKNALESVREVRYHLHPAYGTAETVRTSPFTLDIPAIGEFLLYADVSLGNGGVVRLQRYLDA
jgi:hypothetical protein